MSLFLTKYFCVRLCALAYVCRAREKETRVKLSIPFQVKTLKEQLKSKHLHMDLLRKKIAQLEEKDNTRSALAIDRDDAIVTVQRLHRKVERLQHALGDERVKVTQLKAQLAETNQLKVSEERFRILTVQF